MKPYGLDIVNVGTQVRGYAEAVARFRSAVAGRDAVAAYHPLFEALSWAASLDFRIGELWAPNGQPLGEDWYVRPDGAQMVPGLRWARNTVHHDWANALRLDTDGRRYPRRYPLRYFEWVWRDTTELPQNKRTKGKNDYSKLMAGQPAEVTLRVLGEVFDLVSVCIEPPLPTAES
jgi:hypothetical protein